MLFPASQARADSRKHAAGGAGGSPDADIPPDLLTWSSSATPLPFPAGDIVLLRVAGEIDLATVALLEATIADCLTSRPSHLVVDLSRLTFCSASGAAVLAAAADTASDLGTHYAVSGVPALLHRTWCLLWAETELPACYSRSVVAVTAALAREIVRRMNTRTRVPE